MRFSPAVLASLSVLWGCAPPGMCFAAGTRVATPRGPVRIEDIRVGDTVWAWSLERGEAVARRVLQVHRGTTDRLLAVRFGERVLRTTPAHPVWDAVTGDWRPAGQLEGAEALAWVPGAEAKRVAWSGTDALPGEPVWNLSVDGEQTFFAEGVLVHNKSVRYRSMHDYVPFDGDRTWVFQQRGTQHELVLTSRQADRTEVDGVGVYRLDTTVRCNGAADCVDGERLRSVFVSSTVADGVRVHAVDRVNLDPPIVLLEPDVGIAEVYTTILDEGVVWSEVRGFVPCSNVSPLTGTDLERSNCALHLAVEGQDLEPSVKALLGEYWSSRWVGLVGFAPEGDGGEPWGLVEASCDPIASCDGEW